MQSHYFAVGSVVTWAEAGVGAVATQAFADPAYGKLGLDLMRARKSAPDTLAGLLAADPMREVRQVAMVDAPAAPPRTPVKLRFRKRDTSSATDFPCRPT